MRVSLHTDDIACFNPCRSVSSTADVVPNCGCSVSFHLFSYLLHPPSNDTGVTPGPCHPFNPVRPERSCRAAKSKDAPLILSLLPTMFALRLRRCTPEPVLSLVEGLSTNGFVFLSCLLSPFVLSVMK